MIRLVTPISRIAERLHDRAARIEKAIIAKGVRAGEMAMEMAMSNDNYFNVSGNLRASIGYGVAKDGEIIAAGGFHNVDAPEGNGAEGVSKGKALLLKEASRGAKGIRLIIVAGMPYSVNIEAEGRPVITDAVLMIQKYLKSELG